MKLVYVAGPFRGKSHWDIACNIRRAEALALEVWRQGVAALCPHANTAHFQDAAPDHVWLDGDLEMLRRCDAMVLTPDWRRSSGATAEVKEAIKLGIPCLRIFTTSSTGSPALGRTPRSAMLLASFRKCQSVPSPPDREGPHARRKSMRRAFCLWPQLKFESLRTPGLTTLLSTSWNVSVGSPSFD